MAGALVENLSSCGAFFQTAISLRNGELVELLIDWPARLNEQIPLQLILTGAVNASRIMRYEGRIRKPTSFSLLRGLR
jgi:hypothetical protein